MSVFPCPLMIDVRIKLLHSVPLLLSRRLSRRYI